VAPGLGDAGRLALLLQPVLFLGVEEGAVAGLLLQLRHHVGGEAGELRQHLGRGGGQVGGLAEAVGVEQLLGLLRDADGGEAHGCELAHLLDAGLAVDVQLPAGEL
jgi:hypothetical protein